MANDTPDGEVIFEFLRIGNSVRVSAVHVPTDTEITLVGAPSVGEYGLKLAALRKLNYVLARNRNGA